MRTIHKFVLPEATNTIQTFHDAKVIFVGNQNEKITVWLEVETDNPPAPLILTVVGTGNPVPKFLTHAGSAIFQGGAFVFHVYY